ncbi:MAG: LamG-like jellyroll fold domain-containing protein, partial [Gammaproteobacteria bacterium]
MMKITAYADRISVAPGETINFMVNCEAKTFKADIVRLVCGDMNPDGPGYQERVVRTPATGTYKGRRQVIHGGSFVDVPVGGALDGLASFTVQAFIWPTTPERGEQTLLAHWDERARRGFALSLAADNGGLALTLGSGRGRGQTVVTGKGLLAHEWYFVAATFDAEKKQVTLYQEPLHTHVGTRDAAVTRARVSVARLGERKAPVTIGARYSRHDKARTVCTQHYNGKIDSPRIASRVLDRAEMEALKQRRIEGALRQDLVAAWDFAADITGLAVTDTSPNRLDGTVVHMPARGMTGWNWNGEEMCWRHAPDQYGAI